MLKISYDINDWYMWILQFIHMYVCAHIKLLFVCREITLLDMCNVIVHSTAHVTAIFSAHKLPLFVVFCIYWMRCVRANGSHAIDTLLES